MTTGSTTFTTTHRVIDRVHYNTTVARPAAQPTAASRFSGRFQIVVNIGGYANRGFASLENLTGFTGRQLDDSVLAVARKQLRIGTGATYNLGTLTGTQFNVVNQRTERNFAQVKRVAQIGRDILAGNHLLAYLKTLGRQNISLFTIGVCQQSDTCRTIGIVFNGFYDSGYLILFAFKVNDTVLSFMTTADITHGSVTLVIATARFTEGNDQRFFGLGSRDFLKRAGASKTLTRRSGF